MKRIMALMVFGGVVLAGMAQMATANHDSPKKNQFTVGEIGAGALTPELYYSVTHSNYKKTAAARNKLGYRSTAYLASQWQIDDAEKIDSVMQARAEIEALNMADREVDLAWSTERTKVVQKMNQLQRNIMRIVPCGGSKHQRDLWNDKFFALSIAQDEIRYAYMPNANRKKMYLQMYADAARMNQELVKFLGQLNKDKNVKKLLASRGTREDRNAEIALEAQARWREAGWAALKK